MRRCDGVVHGKIVSGNRRCDGVVHGKVKMSEDRRIKIRGVNVRFNLDNM